MSFTVTLKNKHISFSVNPGETILKAAKRQGIELPYGCAAGVCGLCKSRVICGDVTYPDGEPLALFEEDVKAHKALYCLGSPATDIVLETPEVDGDWEPWDES